MEELEQGVTITDTVDTTDSDMENLPTLNQIKTRPELPRIPVKLNSKEYIAALDSYASTNFLEKILVLKNVQISRVGSFPAVQLGDGQSTLKILRTARILVQIRQWAGQMEFSVVTHLAKGMILSFQFLTEQQAVNDYHHQCSMFGGETRHTVYWVTAPCIHRPIHLIFPIKNWYQINIDGNPIHKPQDY